MPATAFGMIGVLNAPPSSETARTAATTPMTIRPAEPARANTVTSSAVVTPPPSLSTAPPTSSAPPPAPVQPPAPPAPAPDLCGAPANPYGYNFCSGSYINSPPSDICNYLSCIPNFWNGVGYVIQCQDGMFSKSGGRSGSCSYHGGNRRPLYG